MHSSLHTGPRWPRVFLGLQSLYFLVTGIWPLISMPTFELITGPKVDRWLVKTVGVLVAVVGAVLGLNALRNHPTTETRLLAAGSALGLTAIDVVYVAKRRIRWVYLLDAVAELVFVAAIMRAWISGADTANGARRQPHPQRYPQSMADKMGNQE